MQLSFLIQGITFTSNRLVVPTRKAHLLLAHAAKLGKQHDLHEVSLTITLSVTKWNKIGLN